MRVQSKLMRMYKYKKMLWWRGLTFTGQKMKFSIKNSADLVTFTGEILNGKLHFLCSAYVKPTIDKSK